MVYLTGSTTRTLHSFGDLVQRAQPCPVEAADRGGTQGVMARRPPSHCPTWRKVEAGPGRTPGSRPLPFPILASTKFWVPPHAVPYP